MILCLNNNPLFCITEAEDSNTDDNEVFCDRDREVIHITTLTNEKATADNMDSRIGLDYIVDNSDYVGKLAAALDTNNETVKKQVFELLSALCAYSSEGYRRTIETLENYKVNVLFVGFVYYIEWLIFLFFLSQSPHTFFRISKTTDIV